MQMAASRAVTSVPRAATVGQSRRRQCADAFLRDAVTPRRWPDGACRRGAAGRRPPASLRQGARGPRRHGDTYAWGATGGTTSLSAEPAPWAHLQGGNSPDVFACSRRGDAASSSRRRDVTSVPPCDGRRTPGAAATTGDSSGQEQSRPTHEARRGVGEQVSHASLPSAPRARSSTTVRLEQLRSASPLVG